MSETRSMRTFDSGATRDSDTDKLDYNGFNSPAVEHAFATYMHTHRRQADGALRAADNWKKGIPQTAYLKSMHRHFMDLWLNREGYPELATTNDMVEVLCAIRFNVNGMLYEMLEAERARSTVKALSA